MQRHFENEIKSRYDEDLPLLIEHRLVRKETHVTSIEAMNSDMHCGGKSVYLINHHDGSQLLYKPRSLSPDKQYQKFHTWLLHATSGINYREMAILDRHSYGWMQYVSGRTPSRCEMRLLLLQLGVQLAGFHFLRAKDIHHRNIIFSGENAYPIDLEVLFHEFEFDDYLGDSPKERAWKQLGNSVLRIGLLPSPLHLFGSRSVTDTSAIRRLDVTQDLVECLIESFRNAYMFILKNRRRMEEEIYNFKSCIIRHLPRSTDWYQSILDKIRNGHIKVSDLQSGAFWQRNDPLPRLSSRLIKLRESEVIDLILGDIPYFTTIATSLDLWDSNGSKVNSYFRKSGIERAKDFLNIASEGDCEAQIFLIRNSLSHKVRRQVIDVNSFYKSLI